jgi:hypothetical protein
MAGVCVCVCVSVGERDHLRHLMFPLEHVDLLGGDVQLMCHIDAVIRRHRAG